MNIQQKINIGALVLVTHIVEQEPGWNGIWQDDMDKFIGNMYVARSEYDPDSDDAKFKQSKGIWLADNEHNVCDHFPLSSLRLISNRDTH